MAKTTGRKLYDSGWRQGAVIPARLTQPSYPTLDSEVVTHELPEGMQLMLATQDCDLVKPSERSPYVEAIGCLTDPDLAASVMANNTRYFVLDPAVGLLADALVSIPIAKEALLPVSPPEPPCGGDARRARRLARWLGARYDRVAIPDEAVNAIQKPLAAAVKKLCRPGKRHAALNEALHEVRVVGDLDSGPPYVVILLFIFDATADPDDFVLAVAELIAEAKFAIEDVADPDQLAAANVHVRHHYGITPNRLSVEAYFGSVPLALDQFSLMGEETVGAEPLGAESA